MPTPELLVLVNNHFDPTWRRAWDQRFTFRGQTFVSYADLEEYYMLENLSLAEQNPEYKFHAEFPLVVQKFLERHPERLDDLRRLSRAGRFTVSGGGQVIVDGNMILGESLVRNYLIGLNYVEATFGKHTPLAVRNDAFGNPAQLPQILRGCEMDWVSGLSYSQPKGTFWRGLDGSTVVCQTLPLVSRAGGVVKYPPCPDCRGTGLDCPRCGGRGIDPTLRAFLPEHLNLADTDEFGAGIVSCSPEELIPNPELLNWAKAHNARFILETEAFPYLKNLFLQLDNPPNGQIHPDVELNPNNTGVFVTRIRTKQAVRRLEHDLMAAEVLNTLAWQRGQAYPQVELTRTWQQLLFCMFHDAITATHIDASYAELETMWGEIEESISGLCSQAFDQLVRSDPESLAVFNPTGRAATQIARAELPANTGLIDPQGLPVTLVPVKPPSADDHSLTVEFLAQAVPAFSTQTYKIVPAAPPAPLQAAQPAAREVLENERFHIQAGPRGVEQIFDKRLGRNILHTANYRPAELILEHDEGSPWATLHPDQSRTSLGHFTNLVRVERGGGLQKLIYRVEPPFRAGYVANGLSAEVEIKLTEGLERVDFHLTVDWDTFNHRLRMAFPTPIEGKPLYEVPFGALERRNYQPTFDWTGANGDWPALHWGGITSAEASLAVFNRGLPSYRIDPGLVLVSLLRSPAVPTYLHEPEYYTMTEYDGMRDAGQHSFDLAATAYAGKLLASPVVSDADAFNAGMLTIRGQLDLPDLPHIESDCAQVCAVKPAEKGKALVIRLYECRGEGGPVRIRLPEPWKTVRRSNLLERQTGALQVHNGLALFRLRPWEIATLLISAAE